MTQTLFISERSFVAQASSRHQAAVLLSALAQTIKALQPRLASAQPFRIHTDLGQARLTPNLTFKAFLSQKAHDGESHDVRAFLWRVLNAGPFFDVQETPEAMDANNYQLAQNGVDVTGSSIAAASSARAWLASLELADVFSAHPLRVQRNNAGSVERFEIPNFSTVSQVNALRLCYRANSKKHHLNSKGKRSVMDLTDEVAEELLNRSIQADGKKQRYAVEADVMYEFQPDGAGGYHGYRVEREQELMEVPLDIRERLNRVR